MKSVKSRANLAGAYLADGLKLIARRPVVILGPIGSRGAYLQAYRTEKGLYLGAGCWFGPEAEFETRVREVHGENQFGREYAAALAFLRSLEAANAQAPKCAA